MEKYFTMNYKDGIIDGMRTQWYKNGQQELERNYKDGECISGGY
mgnify:CR=1 FL=1|tara:strand:+ start:105 stop:236 length:132 start_codon:yes stop_codon:yes gene_type:complete